MLGSTLGAEASCFLPEVGHDKSEKAKAQSASECLSLFLYVTTFVHPEEKNAALEFSNLNRACRVPELLLKHLCDSGVAWTASAAGSMRFQMKT